MKFKKGDYIICKIPFKDRLTKNKVYHLEEDQIYNTVYVQCDLGVVTKFYAKRFELDVKRIRLEKLRQLKK